MSFHTCCFLGHRNIEETEELRAQLLSQIEELIVTEHVHTFLFGSKSQFNDLCLELVSALKVNYPHIKRVYVRAEYPIINESYERYLLKNYEETYYPAKLAGAGRAAYVKRNAEMIDKSRFCVVYSLDTYTPTNRKSGTVLALRYAEKQKKIIFKFPNSHKIGCIE